MTANNYFCIRQIDANGRIVVPKEIRERLGIIDTQTQLEMYLDGDKAVIKVHTPGCLICGAMENTVEFKNKRICPDCIDRLAKIKELNQD